MLPRGNRAFTSPSSSFLSLTRFLLTLFLKQPPSVTLSRTRTRTEMCNNNAPHLRPTSMIDTPDTVPLKPTARRIRTRTRKPKFLSLKLELSPPPPPAGMTIRHQQLNLFPLHPENLVETHDENVSYLLDTDCCATLTGLLDGAAASSEQESPSLSYAYRDRESEEGGDAMLVRTAMKRSKERQVSEEKWVCYSEVVEKKEEEVTSCSAGPSWWCPPKATPRSLSLKLDYQEVLAAWSDKGSLYIEGPQTVPDLHHDDFLNDSVSANNTKGVIDSWGSVGNLWTVPERRGDISGVKLEEDGGKESCSTKLGQREASVLRYKEKRQNRLFSKRIRYEVRKLNAEKRPRMKGRFVKRN